MGRQRLDFIGARGIVELIFFLIFGASSIIVGDDLGRAKTSSDTRCHLSHEHRLWRMNPFVEDRRATMTFSRNSHL